MQDDSKLCGVVGKEGLDLDEDFPFIKQACLRGRGASKGMKYRCATRDLCGFHGRDLIVGEWCQSGLLVSSLQDWTTHDGRVK